MDRTRLNKRVRKFLKLQKKNDAWSDYFVGGSYETATLHDKYKVEFLKDESSLQIVIWNPSRPCVVMHIHELDGASIDMLKYDSRCTTDHKMERGSGTLEMMEFAFELLRDQKQKTVQLTDLSTFDCNRAEVSLGEFYFIRNGKTWYESKFGFYPITFTEEYDQAKELRKTLDLEYLKTQPCSFFTPRVLAELLRKIRFPILSSMVWQKDL